MCVVRERDVRYRLGTKQSICHGLLEQENTWRTTCGDITCTGMSTTLTLGTESTLDVQMLWLFTSGVMAIPNAISLLFIYFLNLFYILPH